MYFKSAWTYINKGLLIILGVLVVSSIAAIIFLTQTLRNLHDQTQQNGNAVGTAFVLQDLLINLQTVQSTTRGYVLTGNPEFLAAYPAARKNVVSDLRIISANKDLLLTDKQIDKLTKLSNDKLATMATVVETRDAEGYEAAQSILATRSGDTLLQDVREEIADLSSKSLQDIGPMQQRSEDDTRRAMWVAAAMALFVLGTCAAVIWYFRKTILHERALESTKNEFLSLASHQLRTPATNIKQYLGMLLEGYMGELNDQQRKALTVAYKNNESEITIMNNLLDVAKLDLERIQLKKKVVNIMRIVRHVVHDYKPAAAEKKQKLEIIGAKQVMGLVDEEYIKGVVQNLVENAIKYSKDGTNIKITVDRQEDHVCVSVKDRGVGIRKRDLGKLFKKFSRLTNEFSANSEGSGLGLYWVKQVVQLHGGTVDVYSNEGKGTTFTVKLPVR